MFYFSGISGKTEANYTLEVLVAAAAGDIDLNRLAREKLAERGLDASGVWIGFNRAKMLLANEDC